MNSGNCDFRVGDWRVLRDQGVLMKGEQAVHLEPKSMEVLVYLASRAGEVVSREELEREVWRGVVIGYDAVTSTITKLRKAFSENSRQPRYIETIPKRGYRLLATVCRHKETTEVPVMQKPGIAVLPFTNMSGDRDQEYFADGISEDVITGLSKFHWFFVIARNSSFTYKGIAVDVKEVGRQLGVSYLLEGSVRRSGDWVRINAQLIDALNGGHIWAERYDREVGEIFSVQDDISEAIITAVAPAFISEEARRAERKTQENFNAWDYTARGNWHLWHRGQEHITEARRSFELALEIDPTTTTAWSGLAFALCWTYIFGWEDELEDVLERALSTARRAVDIDDGDAWAHAILGWAYFSSRRLDMAVTECERALTLNPSLALAESILSIACSWFGDNDSALRHAQTARRLSPRDPGQSMWSFALACAEFGAGNYEQSCEWAKLATTAMPEFPGAWRYLAASLAYLDRLEEAQAAVQRLLHVMPHDNLNAVRARLPAERPERLARFAEGLRKAGLPD